MTPDATSSAQISSEAPWYLKDLLLPLLVTFSTYLSTHFFFVPVSKWRKMREEMIIISVQYANYKAYSYTAKNGKRKFEDRGLNNTVEQDLRKLAGRVCTLPNYFSYKVWRLLHLLPTEEKIESIRGDLIGWANSLIENDLKYDPNRDVRIESLKKNLGLPNNYKQMKEIQELEWKNARNR
jgi:hypothetical protein